LSKNASTTEKPQNKKILLCPKIIKAKLFFGLIERQLYASDKYCAGIETIPAFFVSKHVFSTYHVIGHTDTARCVIYKTNGSISKLNNIDIFENALFASAYVPFQMSEFDNLFDPDEALCRGTIFPELHLPTIGMGGYYVKR